MAGSEAGSRELRDGTLTLSFDEGSRTLRLGGELDMANAATLEAELERIEAAGEEPLTLDLSELEFIDSTGIAAIVAAHRRANAEAERLRFVRSRATSVQRVMDVTGLSEELPFLP